MKKLALLLMLSFAAVFMLSADEIQPGSYNVVVIGEDANATPYEVAMLTFWYNTPPSSNYTETYGVKGGAPFGVGAPVYGLEASVLGSLTDYVDGIQTSLIMTKGKEVNGLQFSLVNMVERLVGLQLGIVNLADDATFQLGILNYNENGILPLLPVLNFNF